MFVCVRVFSRQVPGALYSSVCVCSCVQPSNSCGTLLKCLCVFVCSAVKFLGHSTQVFVCVHVFSRQIPVGLYSSVCV